MIHQAPPLTSIFGTIHWQTRRSISESDHSALISDQPQPKKCSALGQELKGKRRAARFQTAQAPQPRHEQRVRTTLQTPRRAPDGAPVRYERHRPEQNSLYRLVQQRAASFFAQTAADPKAEAGVDGQVGSLPVRACMARLKHRH
jgi:hypothetical protein